MASRLHQIARAGKQKEGEDFFREKTISGAMKAANALDKMKRTPLHLACWAGNTEMISLLLEHRADCMATAQDAFTPLHFCSQAGCAEGCRLLLRAGARVDAKLNKTRKIALHLAAVKGHAEVVRVLVQAGAKTSLRNSKGETPLDVASNADVRAALADKTQPLLPEVDGEKEAERNVSVTAERVAQGEEKTEKMVESIEGGISEGGGRRSVGAGGGGEEGSSAASDGVRGSNDGAQETGFSGMAGSRVVDKLDGEGTAESGEGFDKGGVIGGGKERKEGIGSLAERRRKKRKLTQANAGGVARKGTISLSHLEVDGDDNGDYAV